VIQAAANTCNRRSHSPIWFQLAKVRLAIFHQHSNGAKYWKNGAVIEVLIEYGSVERHAFRKKQLLKSLLLIVRSASTSPLMARRWDGC
jgi:hypothetical protein